MRWLNPPFFFLEERDVVWSDFSHRLELVPFNPFIFFITTAALQFKMATNLRSYFGLRFQEHSASAFLMHQLGSYKRQSPHPIFCSPQPKLAAPLILA